LQRAKALRASGSFLCTNSSLLVTVDGVNYVYRHPGPGTSEIISREAEA